MAERVTLTMDVVTTAGSGNVVRSSYTVPPARRAIIEHIFLRIGPNSNAANTAAAIVNAPQAVAMIRNQVASPTATQILNLPCNISLFAGDVVQLVSNNSGLGSAYVAGQVSLLLLP